LLFSADTLGHGFCFVTSSSNL